MSSREDRRREPRLCVRERGVVEVNLRQPDGKVADSVKAELQDLSLTGARLLCPKLLVYRQATELNLRCEQPNFDLNFSAEVCWMKPAPNGQWLLGCSFVPELPAGIMENLLDVGVLERRRWVRNTHRIPVLARWEVSSAVLPAFLWDFSEGGFCILSPGKAGREVTIRAEQRTDVEVRAEALWDAEMAGGCVAGCRFLDRDGYNRMLRLLPSEEEQRRQATNNGLFGRLKGAVGTLLGRG